MYRFFIVEDDPSIAAILKQQLESWGHEAHVAEDLADIMPELQRISLVQQDT